MKNKRSSFLTYALVAGVCGVVLGLLAPRPPRVEAASSRHRAHVVAEGETLWGLAARFAPSADRRRYIFELSRINHLSGSEIRPGQTLILPEG